MMYFGPPIKIKNAFVTEPEAWSESEIEGDPFYGPIVEETIERDVLFYEIELLLKDWWVEELKANNKVYKKDYCNTLIKIIKALKKNKVFPPRSILIYDTYSDFWWMTDYLSNKYSVLSIFFDSKEIRSFIYRMSYDLCDSLGYNKCCVEKNVFS